MGTNWASGKRDSSQLKGEQGQVTNEGQVKYRGNPMNRPPHAAKLWSAAVDSANVTQLNSSAAPSEAWSIFVCFERIRPGPHLCAGLLLTSVRAVHRNAGDVKKGNVTFLLPDFAPSPNLQRMDSNHE